MNARLIFKVLALATGVVMSVAAAPAMAGAVLTSGNDNVTLGVKNNGALGFGGVGIFKAALGDGITPGCLCEGWGVAANGVAGWSANQAGEVNISSSAGTGMFGSTFVSNTFLTSLSGLTISQGLWPVSQRRAL